MSKPAAMPTPEATLVGINELVSEAWANLVILADTLGRISNALERAGIKAPPFPLNTKVPMTEEEVRSYEELRKDLKEQFGMDTPPAEEIPTDDPYRPRSALSRAFIERWGNGEKHETDPS